MMDESEAQLLAVEQLLLTVDEPQQREELLSLRASLQELLALTKEGDETEITKSPDALDDELQRFKSELNALEQESPRAAHKSEEEQLQALRVKYNAMVGEKCSAPHEHSWGATSYHNALICGVEDDVIVDNNGVLDVRLRVLYTNPTHREMLPCNYFLEGSCRFDEARCHYSHGAIVPGAAIKDYSSPDFNKLARGCLVLAKLSDRLWHRGRVLCANFVEQVCRVRLDGQDHKEREQDFKFEELFPLITETEEETEDEDSDSSSCTNVNSDSDKDQGSDLDDLEAARQARIIELSLFTFKANVQLGAWEQHTRGIGSKLMAKMGYINGSGLGSDGRGIVTPVSAQILPQGRSLDACMELREAANGNQDYFSVERKLKRAQKRQQAANEKAYARKSQRTDVFSFLNDNVLTIQAPNNSAPKQTNANNLQQHSTKMLNVETVRLADDIKRKQRDIAKLQQSLNRNSSDVHLEKRLRAQLHLEQQELLALQAQERHISKEQQTRKSKNKMFEF